MRSSFMDELSKRAMTDKSGAFMKGFASEVRHRPVSLYGSGQLVADMPEDYLGLSTIIGVFRMNSRKDYDKLRREVPGFDRVPHAQIRELGRGVMRVLATRATDPLFTQVPQEVILRPSVVHAGGETLTAL